MTAAKKAVAYVLAVTALASAFYLDARFGGGPTPALDPAAESSPAVLDCDKLVVEDARADVNLLELARLARGEPCMKPDTWYLKYETPDGPRQMEIGFADGASCSVFGETADCNAMNPPAGSGASFEGYPDGAVLRVTKLEFKDEVGR